MMSKFVNKIWGRGGVMFFMMLTLAWNVYGQDQETALADEYYAQKAWDKAASIYAKIVKDNVRGEAVHPRYFNCLLQLGELKDADKYLKKRIKEHPLNPMYNVDYARLLQAMKNEEGMKVHLTAYLKVLDGDDARLKNVALYLIDARLLEYAEAAYLQGKKRGTLSFDFELADLYMLWGKKELAVASLLDALIYVDARFEDGPIATVEGRLQDLTITDEEWKALEASIYVYLQKYPDQLAYSRMLVWLYLQRKQFGEAFKQAKAVDRRLKLEGQELLEMGNLSMSNEAFKDAISIFSYLVEKYPNNGFIYAQAKNSLIKSKEEIVKRTYPIDLSQIRSLVVDYQASIAEFGVKANTADAVRSLAKLHAFYLQQPDTATIFLEQIINAPRMPLQKVDEAKLDLGDIYVLKNEPWEAVLLYAQVEKSQKDKELGHEAKLRNAKLSYYTGDFELAKAHLDVLKMATTREIANDALSLSLRIADNLELDTTDVVLKEFANINLLVFQGIYSEALTKYEDMYARYPDHSLTDEILWEMANMELKMGQFNKALESLEKIIKDYPEDLYGDDAHYLAAQIYQDYLHDDEKAVPLYVKVLSLYPGSIYVSDARKRVRLIRGDKI